MKKIFYFLGVAVVLLLVCILILGMMVVGVEKELYYNILVSIFDMLFVISAIYYHVDCRRKKQPVFTVLFSLLIGLFASSPITLLFGFEVPMDLHFFFNFICLVIYLIYLCFNFKKYF